MSDINLDKLPKYAREEIVALRRKVDELRRAVVEQRQDEPSNIQWGCNLFKDDAQGYLPNNAQVTFTIAMRPFFRVRARISEDGLHISADSSVRIVCESSNCFTVQERPR